MVQMDEGLDGFIEVDSTCSLHVIRFGLWDGSGTEYLAYPEGDA